MSRKLSFSIAGLSILTFAFILLVADGSLTDTIFGIWTGAILGIIGIYTGGNIAAKKYRPNNGNDPNQGISG